MKMTEAPVLPVLNVQQLRAGGDERQLFLQQLAEAARTVGFFYITGHGLRADQQVMLALTKQFFALPQAQKDSVAMLNSPHFRGYTQIGSELTAGKHDMREQFDVMREEAAVQVAANEPKWWHLYGPNQWPSGLPALRSQALRYQQQLTELSLDLLGAFAAALEQPQDVFGESMVTPYTHMKLIRYPGVFGNSRQGVGAHKDPGYLTIVSPDSQSGLQVKKAEGWVAVPPIEGAFVVNIGELLELASDGYLQATEHRVVSPKAGSERYSVAFFMAPTLASEVPLLQLPKALKEQALGPSSDPQNPLFYQVGENVLKGRVRSHPDVACAHLIAC